MVREIPKNKDNKKIAGLAILIVILVLFFYFGNGDTPSSEILSGNIKIVSDGESFSPSEVNIVLGSTVTFINQSKEDFWPASDLHPTHNVYTEFDALEGVPPGGSYSFKFERLGLWKYHDHLNPSLTGVINVLSSKEADVSDYANLDCGSLENLPDSQRTFCLEEYIREISSEKGITAALEALAQGFQNNPIFAENCHALAHVIGEEAYAKFSAGQDFDADEKTTYCGYGFYHGFMERLLSLENDLDKARDFCIYIDQRVMGGRGNAQLACYHGIGHGFVDGSEKKAWGDEWALTEPALELCDRIVQNQNEGYRCYSGVFNSLSIAYASSLYGLDVDEEDPLWFCRAQKEEKYKLGCYTDMMVALMAITDDDLLEATRYMKTIEEPYLDQSMYTLSSLSVRQRLEAESFEDIIEICHSLDEKLSLQCIKGFSGGLMEFGEPRREYVKTASFCQSQGLGQVEREQCFQSLIDYASFTYPPDRLEAACGIIPIEFMSDRVKRNCNV